MYTTVVSTITLYHKIPTFSLKDIYIYQKNNKEDNAIPDLN